MKLSEAQKKVMIQLSQPYPFSSHHPKDAYNERTIQSLINKGFVEIYRHHAFLHGAVRLTEKGKKELEAL